MSTESRKPLVNRSPSDASPQAIAPVLGNENALKSSSNSGHAVNNYKNIAEAHLLLRDQNSSGHRLWKKGGIFGICDVKWPVGIRLKEPSR